jgi:low temperature requirement protein LtrA
MAGMIVMGASAKHALSSDPAKNTGLRFLVAFTVSRLIFFMNSFLQVYYLPDISTAMLVEIVYNLFLILLFIPLLFFPSGQTQNIKADAGKYILWGIAVLFSTAGQTIHLILPYFFKNRISVNWEHLADRLKLLVVIGTKITNSVLGASLVGFLFEHVSHTDDVTLEIGVFLYAIISLISNPLTNFSCLLYFPTLLQK